MMVLKVRDTNQRGHVEVRGKKGYETKHNKRDKLHQFLDQLDGPTVSTLLGTEDEITLNPKNPDRKQTIKVVNDLIQKNENFTQKMVNDLEKFADRILAKFGIDVQFTKHFVDRLNDPRNSPAIKVSELQKFFKKIQRNKGRNIRNNPDVEAVLKDMSTNLNLPVVIKTKGDDSFEVTNKTIMRKKDFRTTSKVISYEKWSDKYKKSIDCNNPKGFSQRAHCQG